MPKSKKDCKKRVEEVAKIFRMSPEDFRMHCFNRIYKDEIGPGYLVTKGYARKLNVIFDIDHTLVFSIDTKLNLQLASDPHFPKISICMSSSSLSDYLGNGMHEMTIVVRDGVGEMLEFLSEFCNFYVYSHGMREYIERVLEILDPQEKYFRDRAHTVLAPKDQMEQQQYLRNKKSIFDFKSELDKNPIFANEDCLIIDDQF